jgi:hypothetical protein
VKIDLRRRPALLAAGFAFLLWLVAFACFRAPGLATGLAFPRETRYLAVTAAIGLAFSGLVYLAAIGPRRLGRGARVAIAGAAVIALVLIHAGAMLRRRRFAVA